jgi:hypothetical protein
MKKHPSGRITTLVLIKEETVHKWQVIQKCPFLDPLWQLVEESPFVSKPCIVPLKQDMEQSELSHVVELVGSILNYFLNEVIFMPKHQYVGRLLESARKKF